MVVGVMLAGCGYGPLPSATPDGSAARPTCTTNSDCMGAEAICDTSKAGGACVQCTAAEKAACNATTPICDTAADVCTACAQDSECGAGGICRPDGACAAPSNIIHAISVGGSADPSTCGGVTGVGLACTLDTALLAARTSATTAESPPRNVIKLDDLGPYRSTNPSPNANFVVDVDVAFGLLLDARSSDIQSHSNGPIITVNAEKGVTILGATIEGAAGDGVGSDGSGHGIQCMTGSVLTIQDTTIKISRLSAISANSCTVTITHSYIQDNTATTSAPGITSTNGTLTVSRSRFSNNKGGAISATTGHFLIVGNAFQSNGDLNGTLAGISVTSSDAENRLEFNTFFGNKSGGSSPSAILCNSADLVAKDNIIWGNSTNASPVGGLCKHAYSIIGTVPISPTLDGGNNLTSDPELSSDLSVRSDSVAKGKADPAADLTGLAALDINGVRRVAPADIGAYVVPAQ